VKTALTMLYPLDLLTLSFIIVFLLDKLFASVCDLSRLNGPVVDQTFSSISKSCVCVLILGRVIDCPPLACSFPNLHS
jgi:hypothetical protein